jgi:DNA-binding response OmpR family regulator
MSLETMTPISRAARAGAAQPEFAHALTEHGVAERSKLGGTSGRTASAGRLGKQLTVISSGRADDGKAPLAGALRSLGYEVSVASDAFQASARGACPPGAIVIVALDAESAESCLSQAAALDPASTSRVLLCAPVEVVRYLAWARFHDFLAVPFAVSELAERVRRLTQNVTSVPITQRTGVLDVDGMIIDLAGRDVFLNGRNVRLTRLEFDLLAFFVANPKRVLRRAELLASVWGIADSFSRTVDIHLRRLRVKIGDEGTLIQTVRGVGYKLAAEVRPLSAAAAASRTV